MASNKPMAGLTRQFTSETTKPQSACLAIGASANLYAMFRSKGRLPVRMQFIGIVLLALGLFTPGLLAQDRQLVFTAPPGEIIAGQPAVLSLNILNLSREPISWSFPRQIQCRVLAPAGPLAEQSLETDGEDSEREASISPGAFARHQYRLTLPTTVVGRVILEFPELTVEPLVLDVQGSAPVSEPSPKSGLARILQQAEPIEEGREFDPGRFFKEHISGYEPFYFVAGTESPNARFQISFKYQLLNNEGALAKKAPWLRGTHFAYTQTSLWDWNSPSAPFLDSSYKPEALYLYEKVVGGKPDDWFQLDLQTGFQHESNGQDGTDSRSLNILYLRSRLIFGRADSLQFTLEPRAWIYIGDLSDNPDIDEYRGYADLRGIIGWRRGLQLSAIGRLGDTGEYGSLQLDLTYPMMTLLWGSFSVYLHAQYFTGYGESLLYYNERSSAFRLGFSLYR